MWPIYVFNSVFNTELLSSSHLSNTDTTFGHRVEPAAHESKLRLWKFWQSFHTAPYVLHYAYSPLSEENKAQGAKFL